jgi:hypothetical protein
MSTPAHPPVSTTAHPSVDPGSVTPLEEFPLAWRFTTARHALPSSGALARLLPLNRETAARVAHVAIARCGDVGPHSLTFRTDESPGGVRRWLLDLPVDPSTAVVLSWDRVTALVTDWAAFVSHWDDFCYPASDDVAIWPADGQWTLCYRHYEVFQFRNALPGFEPSSPPATAESDQPGARRA